MRFRLIVPFAVIAACALSACNTSVNYTPVSSATPTATPTASPPPLLATPSSLALLGAGATFAQTFTVSEANESGAFSESDTCTGIASVAPSSGHGPTQTLTVTGIASGTCTITVSDVHAQRVAIGVAVSSAAVGVQSTGSSR